MKKILLAATVIITTGVLSIHTRVSNIQPASAIHVSYFDYKKELASGD